MFTDEEFDMYNISKKLPKCEDRAMMIVISKFEGNTAGTLANMEGDPEKMIISIKKVMQKDEIFRRIIYSAIHLYFRVNKTEGKFFHDRIANVVN